MSEALNHLRAGLKRYKDAEEFLEREMKRTRDGIIDLEKRISTEEEILRSQRMNQGMRNK